MKIDGNELSKKELYLATSGKNNVAKKCYEMRKKFLEEIKESGEDYCNCKVNCPHHSKCWECVMIHRGHRDHFPVCMRDMLNIKLEPLVHMTEGSLKLN